MFSFPNCPISVCCHCHSRCTICALIFFPYHKLQLNIEKIWWLFVRLDKTWQKKICLVWDTQSLGLTFSFSTLQCTKKFHAKYHPRYISCLWSDTMGLVMAMQRIQTMCCYTYAAGPQTSDAKRSGTEWIQNINQHCSQLTLLQAVYRKTNLPLHLLTFHAWHLYSSTKGVAGKRACTWYKTVLNPSRTLAIGFCKS